MKKLRTACAGLVLWVAFAAPVFAAGSGLNVAIVVNQNSSNSIQLGNYYAEQRGVPPQNFVRINWAGTNTEWSLADFTNTLLNPLLAALASRQLTNQVDYVVLSMDIPYRVADGANGKNSTTSALYYGFKPDTRDLNECPLATNSTSLYAGSEGIFRYTPPIAPGSNAFLVTMITATNLALAKQTVDQGVLSDSTFPTQTVLLAKSTDTARNVRYYTFDNAVFNARLRSNYSILRTNAYGPPFTNLLGYQTGAFFFSLSPGTFIRGSMADNLTSFGGQLFENNGGQIKILSFLEAGAAGSFGTVVEPCNYLEKFPDPMNYFYQARGFSLAESYYQSLTNPYQGLLLGEPLAAPFAMPGSGGWTSLTNSAVLSGTTNLSFQFTAADAAHPLRHADLFLDGARLQSVTNIPPQPGNVINIKINGFTGSHTVGSNATIGSVVSNLNTVLGASPFPNLALVEAAARGDRIELQSTDPAGIGSQVSISVSSTNPSGSLTTFIASTGTNFTDSTACGYQTFVFSGAVDTNSFLQLVVTKTNGTPVVVAITNTSPSTTLVDFAQQLMAQINANTNLQAPDGVVAEDLEVYSTSLLLFHLRASTAGHAAAQIQAALTGSVAITITPPGTNGLTYNIQDLRPRNHLYVTAGTTNLAVTFLFNTTNLADGWHELTAVAYEGSHVHTQVRSTRAVLITNNPLSATFTTLVGGSNSAVEAMLQFNVTANTNAISNISLFSTGGLLATITNQPSSTFNVAATNLGIGLHPFYAVVTASNGKQYRTETSWIRLVGLEAPFTLQLGAPPPLLVWPAVAGRSYDILSTSNLNSAFQLRSTVVVTNNTGQWLETNAGPAQQFYRVRVTP